VGATNKTRPTTASAEQYLAAVQPELRRADALEVCTMLQRVTGEDPVLWGTAIVAFGAYHYEYGSGRRGTAPRIGFSPRWTQLTIDLTTGFEESDDLLGRLGPRAHGKSCLHLKKLELVDRGVLEELLRRSWTDVERRYPT